MRSTANSQHPLAKFRERWFPKSEDQLWQDWLELGNGNYQALKEFIEGNTKPTMKARAMIILLAHDISNLPILWIGDKPSNGSFLSDRFDIKLKGLPLDILVFMRDLLKFAKESIRETNTTERIFQGINYFTLELLTHLPIDCGRIIWPPAYLDFGEPSWSMDDSSGYHPWQQLMQHPGISIHWKRIADSDMRIIIEDELAGRSKPRAEWEDALRCYIQAIEYFLYLKPFPYDVALLAEQLNFITSKGSAVRREVFPQYNLEQLCELMVDNGQDEALRSFLEFRVLQPDFPITITVKSSLKLAELILFFLDPENPAAKLLQENIDCFGSSESDSPKTDDLDSELLEEYADEARN